MNDWKQTLYAARKEYNELIQQRDDIDSRQADLDLEREKLETRIVQLQKTIDSLSEMVGENPLVRRLAGKGGLSGRYDNLKLAEAVRKVLQSADQYWTPINVRDALQAQQYDLGGYTNPLASIHAVLKRIFEAGEAFRLAGQDGKAMYRWKSSANQPPAREEIRSKLFSQEKK